ncbi:Crp/Fnr family transcriptional regulator [Chitinophaga sp. 22321]|uniref:Crp/Fnr family transcriptional regulator n=1 Tax=Chitinophaga hostae TaxID=2831022 RepID=A0ABS5JAH0_9BACT|nr:Crp/Fnr family transcriptional regulator [Chitinophaga hostae]MBS0031592.1 Crp/Fnr family transcriptional regulator [Chitinophaga hostae]
MNQDNHEYDPALNVFFNVVGSFMSLSPESKNVFAGIMTKRELPKGTQLLTAGQVCRHIFYIEKGLARTYYIKDGKDVTDWISVEQTFSVSIVSFITGKPDIRNIELLEAATIWEIGADDIQHLYDHHHEIERLGRLLVSQGLVQMQQRFDDLHFSTARERYLNLITMHPTIIQRAPLGMVASYLGITQETLSRIRAGLTI